MELNVYDRDMTPIGVVDEIASLIWTRRYSRCGEFKLLVPFTPRHVEYLQKNRLLMRRGDDEAAEIRFVHIRKNIKGVEEIEAQGKFLPMWIGKRIIRAPIAATAPTHDILARIVRENLVSPAIEARRVPALAIAPMDGLQDSAIEYVSEPFTNALLACETAAAAARLGFRISTDARAKAHTFRVYRGRDLTASQTETRPCIFSQEFDNILEQTYINSVENLKTNAYIGGEDKKDAPRKYVEVGAGVAGLDRNEVFVNATDIVQKYKDPITGMDVTRTDAQVLDLLAQRGAAELENMAETLAFSSVVNVRSNLKYREDYDLGDRVTCINRRWGVRIDVRITEIAEIYQANKEEIDITFGETLPTLSDTIRRMAR